MIVILSSSLSFFLSLTPFSSLPSSLLFFLLFFPSQKSRERKKERKKEIIAIRRHTHKRLTRVPKGGKGKKGSKAQASDGRRARFLFAVVRRVFETE